MRHRKTFLSEKYYALLLSGTLSTLVVTLVLMSDSVVAGLVLGEDAVAGISLVAPVYTLAAFFGGMISIGVPILYNRAMGAFDKESADRTFGFGLVMAAAVGLVLFLAATLFGDAYLRFFEPGAAAYEAAKPYLFWCRFTILLLPINFLLTDIVLADGDEALSVTANLAQLGVNLALSAVLSLRWGMAGISVGSLAGTVLAILISLLHFFRPGSSLTPRLFVSWEMLRAVCRLSIVDAGAYLFLACFSAAMNRFVIVAFGQDKLILASVILLVKELQIVFDGVGEAITPLMSVYLGEGSYTGAEECWRLADRSAITEGVATTLAVLLLAPLAARVYGIRDGAVFTCAVEGIRICALGLTALSLLYLLSAYYLILDKITMSFAICALRDLVLAVPLGTGLGRAFGVYGMFAGVALSPVLAWLAVGLYVRLRYGRENWPLLLADRERLTAGAFYEFPAEPEKIVQVRDAVEGFLERQGTKAKTVFRVKLLVEELFMLIREKNAGRRTPYAECTVLIRDDGVQLITKDDGVLFALADQDAAVDSFEQYIVDEYIGQMTSERLYLKTMSYNRNTFLIKNS